jgi:DNA replication factor CDT1 like/DNA replication factor Cdt1 C-terminal domain
MLGFVFHLFKMMQTPRRPRRQNGVSSPPSSGKKSRTANRSTSRHADESNAFTPAKPTAQTFHSPDKASDVPVKPLLLPSAQPSKLPAQYSLLLDQFALLEEVCGLFRIRGQVPLLKEVAPNVERVSGRRFNMARLQQILAIAPDLYRLEDQSIVQTGPDGALAGRLTSSDISARFKSLESSLLARVSLAREGKENFDIENDCPMITPLNLPLSQLSPPRTPKPKTPLAGRLSLTASPVTPLQLPLSSTPRTPRDKSLTPREELAAMRERVKAKAVVQADQAVIDAKDAAAKIEVADQENMVAMVSTLAKKFYQKGHNSMRLDLLVKDLNKTSVRFGSAADVEKLIRKISVIVPDWLSVAASEFSQGAEVVKVSQSVAFAAVQKRLKQTKTDN